LSDANFDDHGDSVRPKTVGDLNLLKPAFVPFRYLMKHVELETNHPPARLDDSRGHGLCDILCGLEALRLETERKVWLPIYACTLEDDTVGVNWMIQKKSSYALVFCLMHSMQWSVSFSLRNTEPGSTPRSNVCYGSKRHLEKTLKYERLIRSLPPPSPAAHHSVIAFEVCSEDGQVSSSIDALLTMFKLSKARSKKLKGQLQETAALASAKIYAARDFKDWFAD
jgi:hypothetical protein